jgi:Zn-dependent protease
LLSSLFSNPIDTLLSFLLTVPGLLLALCAHEAAHGLAAYLCGDPTAKMMGRVTLNPARHLDPMGTLCMLLFRFGWAKPVPVNPYNFRNPRRDDLIVSLAGITANLLMCLAGCVIMYIPLTMALRGWGGQYYDCAQFYHYAYGMSDLIREAYGAIPCYLYEIVAIFSILNLSLAFFNLLPIPPLDGYHVLNDLILRNSDPFAGQRAARIGQVVILLILFVPQLSDLFDTLRTAVFDAVFGGLGNAVYGLLQLTGVM